MALSLVLAMAESLPFDISAFSAERVTLRMTNASPPLQGEDLGGDGVTQACYGVAIHAIALP